MSLSIFQSIHQYIIYIPANMPLLACRVKVFVSLLLFSFFKELRTANTARLVLNRFIVVVVSFHVYLVS
jgi:hypothetical protein